MDVIVYAMRYEKGQEHAAGRRLLAEMLRRELNMEPMPEISVSDGGKPFFPSRPDICFNIGHSHGAVVCAIHDQPIGVDIEKIRTAPKRLAAGRGDEEFFRWWTAGEAALKREGGSVMRLLRSFSADPLVRHLENLLPGWIVAVCPAAEAPVRGVVIELE